VKPVDLMRWLVRLVTPPHGLILDPFAGTGTTGEAAIHEHKHAILIEREMSYMPLIIARLHKPIQTGFDFDQEPA
jgi:DNA modification methylase